MKKTFFSFVCVLSVLFVSTALAQYVPQPPFAVESLSAQMQDDDVTLTWSETQDQDGGVIIGYKVYYGTQSVMNGGQYDDEIFVEGGQTSYTLRDLSPGTYYMSVTAVDDERGESRNFSPEVSATIAGAMDTTMDTGSPKLLDVMQLAANEIQIEMSEPVSFENVNESFFVLDTVTGQTLTILDVQQDANFLFLLLESLQSGTTYQVTATSQVQDMEGNPVASGITDSAEFTAEDLSLFEIPEEENILPEPEPEPTPSLPEPTPEPEVIPEPEPETSTQNPDAFGPTLTPDQREEIESMPEEDAFVPDTTPPQDVRNMQVDRDTIFLEGYVTLSWQKAVDTDGDIRDQILFTRVEGGDWDNGYSIGKDTETIQINVDDDTEYEVRIVTEDTAGNLSPGRELTFDTTLDLPQTGASTFGIVIAIAIVFGVVFVLYRRQKRLY